MAKEERLMNKLIIRVMAAMFVAGYATAYATPSPRYRINYNLLNEDPTLFTRALVVGASGNPEATKDIKAEILDYHGADDDYIPAVRVKAFAEAVNAQKADRMKVETLKKTGHAESESAAYSKNDAWKWLFR